MPKSKIFYYANGNHKIGLGHIMRCCSLAQMMESTFSNQLITIAENDLSAVQSVNIFESIHYIKTTKDLIGLISINDILVIDNYEIKANDVERLRDYGITIVYIEDFVASTIPADVVINSAGGIDEYEYDYVFPTEVLTGPKYALVQQTFYDRINNTLNTPQIDVLIAFGGVDNKNLTTKVLTWLNDWKDKLSISIVLGVHNKFKDELLKLVSKSKHDVTLDSNLSPEILKGVMKNSKVVICSSSVISVEACVVNTGLLTGYYTDNQRKLSDFYRSEDLATVIGDFNLLNKQEFLSAFDKEYNQTHLIHKKNQSKVFINPKETYLKLFRRLFLEKELIIRTPEIKDVDQYFEWVNDKEVRKNAHNTSLIEYEDHVSWFSNKLKDPNSELVLIESNGKCIGQVRFDKLKTNWVIDYSIDAAYRGQGLAKTVLKLSIQRFSKRLESKVGIEAIVKTTNVASLKVFDSLKFKRMGNIEVHGVQCAQFLLSL